MTLTDWSVICTFGVLFSGLGSLVGLGGGVFMVPILVMGFGVPLKIAIPAITFCLLPSSLLSTVFNHLRRRIDYFAAITLEIPTIVGAVIGSALTNVLPVRPLEACFAVFVAFMGWRIFHKRPEGDGGIWHRINRLRPVIRRQRGELVYHTGIPALGFFGLSSGLIAGLFGVGGGVIKTPVMLRIFRMPAQMASATAICMMVFTSATAAFSHWRMGNMDWSIALPLSASFFTGSLLANSLGAKLTAQWLEKILGVTLMAAAATVMYHVLR